MNRLQRTILALVCLGMAWCCVRVPWHFTLVSLGEFRAPDRWIWSVASAPSGGPDLAVTVLRMLAVSVGGAALFLLAGLLVKSSSAE